MSDEVFLHEYRQGITAKCLLMDELSDALDGAHNVRVIASAFNYAKKQFQDFSRKVETPFFERHESQLRAPPSAELFTREQKASVERFIRNLQKFKYDEPYASDPDVTSALADFEFCTARIPPK